MSGLVVAGDPGSEICCAAQISTTPLDEFRPRRFRCHMGVTFTIRELRGLDRFCLEQADQSGTADGRAALRALAENYAAAAASLAASRRRCTSVSQ
jgi:hypothetical protein